MRVTPALLPAYFLLQSCSSATPDSNNYFPLQPGLQWDYIVTTKVGNSSDKSVFSVYTSEPVLITSVPHALRITSDGTRYYLTEDSAGISRIAKRTLVEATPRIDDTPRWVLKRPYKTGTNWSNPTHLYVLRRIHPYEEKLGGGMNLKMAYQIAGLSESVAVPAGRFENCLRVEGEAHFTIYADGRTGYADVVVNTTEWYAPGVGLIKLVRDEPLSSDVFAGGQLMLELKQLIR